jgi:hypothetical protein
MWMVAFVDRASNLFHRRAELAVNFSLTEGQIKNPE